MKIKSEHRKQLLELVSYFHILPTNKTTLLFLINQYPKLDSLKTLRRTIRYLVELKIVKQIKLFEGNKNQKDCLMLTENGIRVCKENGIFNPGPHKELYKKDKSQGTYKYQHNTAEVLIFMNDAIRSGYLNKNISGTVTENELAYLEKNSVVTYARNKGEYEEYLSHFSKTRITGLLVNGKVLLPVYNLKDTNIVVLNQLEDGFRKYCEKIFFNNSNSNKHNDKVLFSDSGDVLDKTVLFNNDNFENRLGTGEKKSNIFQRKLTNRGSNYLILKNEEQEKLLYLLKIENAKVLLEEYIRNRKKKMIEDSEEKVRQRNSGKNKTYYKASVYETETEVGFQIMQQDLSQIYRIYIDMVNISEGLRSENRKLIIYCLKENLFIYEKVFKQFKFMKCKILDTENVFRYIDERAGEKQN